MSKQFSVALFGTMLTGWRVGVREQLLERGFTPIDNTDPRWEVAETAEDIRPLLEQDHRLMAEADAVLWHHDAGAPGATARFEPGAAQVLGRPTVMHVEPGVVKREYMRALCLQYPTQFYWAETWEAVFATLERIAASRRTESAP
jgi:hypothetical protein